MYTPNTYTKIKYLILINAMNYEHIFERQLIGIYSETFYWMKRDFIIKQVGERRSYWGDRKSVV